MAKWERILKLAHGRPTRRLELIHQGHVDLYDLVTIYGVAYPRLASWGLLAKLEPVHFLDAYEGYRPTAAGEAYFLHDEPHHVIVCRKNKVQELQDRAMDALKVDCEAAMVSFVADLKADQERGWKYASTDEATHQQRDRAQARYVARGYMPLKRFQDKHDLSHDELHVAGVLRYLQPRDPNTVPHTVVGAKAKDCLLLSTKWQLILVKPGQEEELLRRCAIAERGC
ncbi:MAG: hypothetical protein IPN85_03330 [Flavobacteriales bacterium]|nr:hypothetical protein [Flavobacteriales bacterium]MBK9287482.1 hypothetical protein [Flavobacteriales bacterium]